MSATLISALSRTNARPDHRSPSPSPLPRVLSNGTPLPRTGSESWAQGAWSRFMGDSSTSDAATAQAAWASARRDAEMAIPSSWGSLGALNDIAKSLPAASSSNQLLAPADDVSGMSTLQGAAQHVVYTVPPAAMGIATSAGPPQGTSAGPPQGAMSAAPPPPVQSPPGRKRKAEEQAPVPPAPPSASTGEVKLNKSGEPRKKRKKLVTPSYIPNTAIVPVPVGGLTAGSKVVVTLETEQIVQVTIGADAAAASAASTQLAIRLDTNDMHDSDDAQYKVDLRGGRVQWVTRKRLETILRNRRSAAACRNTVVELREEVDELKKEMGMKDALIAKLQMQIKTMSTMTRVGSGGKPLQSLADTSAKSPKTAAQGGSRLVRTFSAGCRRAAPWY